MVESTVYGSNISRQVFKWGNESLFVHYLCIWEFWGFNETKDQESNNRYNVLQHYIYTGTNIGVSKLVSTKFISIKYLLFALIK